MLCFTACKRIQKWRGSRHFQQNSGPFLAHSSTFRCWVHYRRFRRWGLLCRKLERSKSLVILQVGGLTCRWQWHSVKTFLLRMLNDSWAGQNPTKGCSADWRRRSKHIVHLLVKIKMTLIMSRCTVQLWKKNGSFTHCFHNCSFTVRGELELYILQSDKKHIGSLEHWYKQVLENITYWGTLMLYTDVVMLLVRSSECDCYGFNVQLS
jgi:hypothetical protein